jgi:tRNA A37 threonylcarbamoyladenosine dehydratase
MNVKQVLGAAAMVMMAGMAFAEKPTEWTVPDAAFKSAMTRAEVRNDLRNDDRHAWHQRDGEDMVYSAEPQRQSRSDVRTEIARTAHSQRANNINSLYFGD